MRILILASISFFLMISFSKQAKIDLIVEVEGGKANEGIAFVSLFESEDTFLKQPMMVIRQTMDEYGNVQVQFSNLSAGRYAVSVAYDEDSNGELNTGFLGIPTELVGFSNNAKGRWGPPSFEKASFHLEASGKILVRLGKAKD